MVSALKPGGWLVVEDFGGEPVPEDVEFPLPAVLRQVREATLAVMRASGVRRRSLASLRNLLAQQGLTALGAEGRIVPWVGGADGGRLSQANAQQLAVGPLAVGTIM